MISDLDIYRAANLVISRHGPDALVEAARMVDRMLELGDPDGRAVWRRIRRAIEAFAGKPEWGDALGRFGRAAERATSGMSSSCRWWPGR